MGRIDNSGVACGGGGVDQVDSHGDVAAVDPGSAMGLDTRYRVLIDHSPDAIVVHEGHSLVFVNPAALRLIGATHLSQVVGHPMAEFVSEHSVTALFTRIRALDGQGAASEPTEMVLRHRGGGMVDVEARSVLTMWDARPAYLVVLRDLTAQKDAEAAALSGERQFTTVVSTLVEGVIVLDGDGVVNSINPAACAILGVGEEVVDATGDERLMHRVATTFEDGRPLAGDEYSRVRSQRTGAAASFVRNIRRPDGSTVWVRGTTQMISGAPHTRVVVSFTDITEERKAAARLQYQATHDSMTDLPNRLRVVETLTAALDDPDRGPIAVLFIDLDNLKTVNDTLGHSIGDDVLRTAAGRLRAVVPRDGIVGRVGGDEFVAMVHGDDGYIDALGDTIHATLTEPMDVEQWTLAITASVGVVLVPMADTRTIDDLLRDADLAMYAAKDAGGRRTVRFSPRLRHRADDAGHR